MRTKTDTSESMETVKGLPMLYVGRPEVDV